MICIAKEPLQTKQLIDAGEPSISPGSLSLNTSGNTIAPLPETLEKDNTLFCRYELKYRVYEWQARAIALYIQTYLHPDKYASKSPDYQYLISSLYFDSPRLALLNETVDKMTNRFKLRLRCYDDNPQSSCFFEIKRRLNTVILKGRGRTSKDNIKSIVCGAPPPEGLSKKDLEVIKQYQLYMRMLNGRPITMIRYMRQAFEDDSTNRVRITFDRKLSYKTTNLPMVTTTGPGWNLVPMDFVILEIKFTNFYPEWLTGLVKGFNLKQSSFSKYVSSVKQSHCLGYGGFQAQIGEYEYE